MHIDSKLIGPEWASSRSRRLAEGIVQDVLREHRPFTRVVKFNERAVAVGPEANALVLEKPYVRQMLSKRELERKIKLHGDLSKNQDALLYLLQHDSFLPMAEALCEEYPGWKFERGGLIFYRRSHYMGWHTNSTNPVNRIYFAFSDRGDSGFLSYDPEKKSIRDDRDEAGWNIREFEAGDGVNDPLYWHAVYSWCNRISIGFRVTRAVAENADTGPVLEGRHLFEKEWAEGLQLSRLTANKRYSVPLGSLQYLLTPARLKDVRLADIAYRAPEGEGASGAPAAAAGDAGEAPGIVASGMPNPGGKPLRLIDGNRRLHRMLARGESHGRFYVLTAAEVMAHLVVEDFPSES